LHRFAQALLAVGEIVLKKLPSSEKQYKQVQRETGYGWWWDGDGDGQEENDQEEKKEQEPQTDWSVAVRRDLSRLPCMASCWTERCSYRDDYLDGALLLIVANERPIHWRMRCKPCLVLSQSKNNNVITAADAGYIGSQTRTKIQRWWRRCE
jgi:hypothetical protein